MIKFKSSKAISMVSLVITIILLVILSSITILSINGNDGILFHANRAKVESDIADTKENIHTILYGVKKEDGYTYKDVRKAAKEVTGNELNFTTKTVLSKKGNKVDLTEILDGVSGPGIEVEYLQSTGKQAVPTDIIFYKTDIIEIELLDEKYNKQWENWFGIISNEMGMVRRYEGQIEFELNKKYQYVDYSKQFNGKKMNLKINIPESTLEINDTAVNISKLTTNFTKTDNAFYIFTKLDTRDVTKYEVPGSFKMYSLKITDSTTGELRVNLIPILDNENNRPCFYDVINDKYYYNETNTELIAGPEV